MKTSKNLFVAVFYLVYVGVLLSVQANAQGLIPNFNTFNQSILKKTFSAQTSTPNLQTNFDNLIVKAHQKGTVKVIIGLRLENEKLDAKMNNFGQSTQRAEIKQKQLILLNGLRSFEVINPKQFEYIPFLAIEIAADALESLRGSDEIVSIQEDEMQQQSLTQSIPILGGSAFGGATGGTFSGFSGAGRTVAILDTGVDKNHPFFNNRVVSEACYSTTSATSASICPSGASSSTAANSGLHCTILGCTHGTHVAGIAAGGNPQIFGNGVARNANIIAVQVFSRVTNCQSTTDCTTSFNSDVIFGLERVYALRTTYAIDAVNMSLGGGQHFNYCDTQEAAYKTIIDNLRAAGIATIVASGNNGYTDSVSSPACISTAFSVGSTNDGDVLPIDFISNFSNSATFLNLLAPGELILSSVPGGIYDDKDGTSMAAPMVAGAWAVMKQKFPTDTVTQTFTRLKYGGVQTLDSRTGLVKPRIKLDTSLNTSNIDPCNSSTAISFGQTVNGTLANTDCIIPSGSRTDIYTFSGTQGQSVAITESSSAFFTYLFLFNASGSVIGQNGNAGTSRIPGGSGFLTLPATGTYYIYATSVEGNRFGNYTLNLATNGCSFAVSSSSQNFAANGGNGSFNVTTAAGCAWTAQSNAAWLTTASSGNGNGAVNYAVAANTSATQRTGTITLGGQTHTVTQAGAVVPNVRRPFDYDGDGKADVSVFRPSVGDWYVSRSSDNSFFGTTFGQTGDAVAPADFDGDGKTDVSVYREGNWYRLNSSNGTFAAVNFGLSTDLPIPADFDGDGKADVSVFRPSNGSWYRLNSSNGEFVGTSFGTNGDKPLIGDFDGDGKADVAVFRPSNGSWYRLNSSNGAFVAVGFGISEDKPVPADYDGDGKSDVAVYRPSNGVWYRLNSSNGAFEAVAFGTTNDLPTAADFDGDAKADVAVFRPSNGTWYLLKSTSGFSAQTFGLNGDRPTPNAFVR